MTESNETEHKLELKEFIKLMKMSKGWNWEIKVLGDPILKENHLKHLQEINQYLEEEYGE